MAVDLFALRMNMEVTGAAQAQAALQSVNAQGQQTAVTAAQATAALQRMGLSGQALATSLQRMGFQSTAAAAAGIQLGGAMSTMTAQMATASGTIIHPMAMAMSGASTAALNNAVAVRQMAIRQAEAARAGQALTAVKTELAGVLGSGLFRFFAIAGAIDMTRRAYNATTEAADRQIRSTLMLDGVSRIAGLSLAQMQRVASQVHAEFRTSTATANELTASAARLTSKAGESAQTFQFLSNWLNVAAAQGIGMDEALLALNITLRGQDEGLDRLFQKNPSVIWREYAESVNKSVGALTEQEKWLAIVKATQEAANKVGDAYGRFLDTTPGKQDALNAKMEDFAAALGRVVNPLRSLMADIATPFLNWLGDVIERMTTLGALGPGLGGIAARLGQVIAGRGASTADWDDGDTAFDGVVGGGSSTAGPRPLPSKAEIEAAAARRKAHIDRMLGVLDVAPVDELSFLPSATTIATRDDRLPGTISPGTSGRGSTVWDQFEREQRRRAAQVARSFGQLGTNLGMTLADGFAAGMSAMMQGKNPFTAFGKAVLSGLGGIFTQMGAELIAYGVIMLNLLPFLSNPFTSGPAAIAAGAALVALGTVLGGIATGPGGSKGGSSGGLQDKTTHITLTADGLGGRTAPNRERGPVLEVIGIDTPRGQRALATGMGGVKRRNMVPR
jgi:hypothetical protein